MNTVDSIGHIAFPAILISVQGPLVGLLLHMGRDQRGISLVLLGE